ncbi:hypothetical protein ACXGQW_07870 [Wenyingzhuangia sp. IMCC45533]
MNHTHLNDPIDTGDGLKMFVPIRMFSPRDVYNLILLINQARLNKDIDINEVGVGMLSSTGSYDLRYSGDINNIPNYSDLKYNFEDLNRDFRRSTRYKSAGKSIEKAFYKFLEKKMGLDPNNISLYKKSEDNIIQKITPMRDNNNKIKDVKNEVPCK